MEISNINDPRVQHPEPGSHFTYVFDIVETRVRTVYIEASNYDEALKRGEEYYRRYLIIDEQDILKHEFDFLSITDEEVAEYPFHRRGIGKAL